MKLWDIFVFRLAGGLVSNILTLLFLFLKCSSFGVFCLSQAKNIRFWCCSFQFGSGVRSLYPHFATCAVASSLLLVLGVTNKFPSLIKNIVNRTPKLKKCK